MRGLLPALAILLLFSPAAFSQEGVGKKAFYIHSLLGVNTPGISDLNTALSRSGHLELPTAYLARGGGLYAFFRNTRLVQLFTFSSYSGSREAGSRRSWARGTQIGSAFGVDLRQRTRLQAIPYAGVAYSFFGLRVSNTAGTNGAFQGYLSGPANQHQLTQNQWLANLGLHLGASPVAKAGFAQKLDLAIRAGYFLPIHRGEWKTGDMDLGGGPEVNTGGFYAGLVLGIRQ